MHLVRAILVVIIALSMAAFPAGMTHATAFVAVTGSVGSLHHSHAEKRSGHDHGTAASDLDRAVAQCAVVDEGCLDHSHASAEEDCGTMCCGFACHAFQPATALPLSVPLSHPVERAMLDDNQVGGGMPFSIDRPPRRA